MDGCCQELALQTQIIDAAGRLDQDQLPAELVKQLREHFSSRRVRYVRRVLSIGELNLIDDLADALIIARIKRMPMPRLKHFDNYIPRDKQQQKTYEVIQLSWIKDEEYLLGTRLGRGPTQRELFADFVQCQNGIRFRAYYVLKYPERMKLKAR